MTWTKIKYFLLIIGLIYSPGIQLGWLEPLLEQVETDKNC